MVGIAERAYARRARSQTRVVGTLAVLVVMLCFLAVAAIVAFALQMERVERTVVPVIPRVSAVSAAGEVLARKGAVLEDSPEVVRFGDVWEVRGEVRRGEQTDMAVVSMRWEQDRRRWHVERLEFSAEFADRVMRDAYDRQRELENR